jgi:DNA-binding NarL/FixJ family response regulator
MAPGGSASDDPPRVRVAVVADQHLVAESVRVAVVRRGYDAVAVRWRADRPRAAANSSLRLRPSTWVGKPPPDVALLLSDLSKIAQVRSAQTLLGDLDVPWMVMTGVPAGPAWGALYDSGAALVVSSDTDLDTLCGLLDDLYAGRTLPDPERLRELVRSWRALAQHRHQLSTRIGSLTGREGEVLQQLYEGLAVRAIAAAGEVTEATVRSQVKAILRKLEVNSQMAAVTAYREMDSTVLLGSMVEAASTVPSPGSSPARA